ncbi:MAG TPA: DUF4230 domain-containing protein [Allosphingosinicella sp.]
MRRSAIFVTALALGLVLGALLIGALRLSDLFGRGPDPETVAASSLQSVRAQSRLVPFAARFVAVVTASQTRLGLKAQKTLIMPGLVRYEVDLARMSDRDLDWDGDRKILTVTLPPLEISGPEINLNEIREYSGGGILMALTDAENALDSANRQRGQQELIRQARETLPMQLARDAAVRSIERSFAMPMKAAGIDAQVVARFRS